MALSTRARPPEKARPGSVPGSRRLRPIETATLQDQVYREIKRQIMAGAYKPGQTLSMQNVADALRTSTMPVREAMRRLAAQHAVEIRPKRAIRIPLMSRERFTEIADTRVALEGLVTEYAARHITAAELAALERIASASEGARGAADVQGYLAQNQAFHFTIYRAGHSQILLPIIESLWLQIGPVLGLYTESGLQVGAEYHGLVIQRLQARDGPGARAALISDVAIGMQHLLDTTTFDAA